MKHKDKPEIASHIPDELIEVKKRLFASGYYQHILPLRERLKGKLVSSSQAGRSGYLVYFEDGTWLICYLKTSQVHWIMGAGQPITAQLALIHEAAAGDGSEPLTANLPCADESCDIASEVRNAHGQRVTGIAIGENSFNLCFPDGMELDTTVVPTPDGRKAIRVFWEQW